MRRSGADEINPKGSFAQPQGQARPVDAVEMGLTLKDAEGEPIEPEDLKLALNDDDAWDEEFGCIPSDEVSAFLVRTQNWVDVGRNQSHINQGLSIDDDLLGEVQYDGIQGNYCQIHGAAKLTNLYR